MAMALDDILLRFTWPAWHLPTSTFVLPGMWHLWHWGGSGGAWSPLVARGAGGHLRGRRGTCSHPLSFCVAGVALGDIYLHLAWQAWHVWHWAGSVARLVAVSRSGRRGTFAWQAWRLLTSTFVFRGSRGTWRHLPAFGVAGGALVALGWLWWRARGFAWQAWRLLTLSHIHVRFAHVWHCMGWVWWRAWSPLAWRHFVALGDIDLRFARQA